MSTVAVERTAASSGCAPVRACGIRAAPALRAVVLAAGAMLTTAVGGEGLGDFDGDGVADVLLRHADGNWRLEAAQASASGSGPVRITPKLDWYWAGAGDFNGDGRDDAMLRRRDGVWAYYPLDGRRVIVSQRGWANLTRNLDWRVVGVADFNADGRDDILVRRSDGVWAYYPMNGRRVITRERGWANLPRNVDWRMAGTGDFNGDGRADVLLRHIQGEWRYYSLDGRRVVASQPKGTRLPHDLHWHFAGAGDFDGDGRDEVLLRHAGGRWQSWTIDAEKVGDVSLDPDWAWRLIGVRDRDGDGRDDVLLRRDGGELRWRLMDGLGEAVRAGPSLVPGSTAWAVPARPVHFPDPALRAAVAGTLEKAAGDFVRRRELATLGALEADFADITDLTGIGAAVGLTRLNLEFNGIGGIAPLAGLVRLRSLYLRANRIGDIATLAYLPTIEFLDLGDNRIVDVSALAGLVALRRLDLDLNHGGHTGHAGVGIEDIRPLAGLTRLTHLDLSFNRIHDVSPLAGLKSLVSLDLFENRVVDITPIRGLTGLTTLSLARNRIEDLSALSRLTGLTFLWVGENSVVDWSPLAGLTRLTSLGLWSSGIDDLSVLAGMTGLRSLWLYDNSIEDISLLARFPALESLRLAGNRIADIGALEGLTRLEELQLDRNRISDVSPLARLRALERLSLGGNEIGDITPLADLTSLVRLVIQNNRVEDISSLANLTTLELLDLSQNRIVDIAPLEHLTNLDELRLAFNRISDLTALTNNAGLGEGDLVDVRGNPLSGASLETAVDVLLARGVRVEVPARTLLDTVHKDSVAVLRVEEDIAALDLFSGLPLDAYASALFADFEDAFDFLMFFSNLDDIGDHQHAHYFGLYSSVRNDTSGTGQRTFYDNRYGSAERLKGVIHFPYNRALRHGPALHEMLHAWANFTVPSTVGAHWGFSSADGQLGGFDIGNLVELGDGRYAAGRFGTFANGGNGLPYSPIELYLAGYIPPEEVPDLWVAADGEWVLEDGNLERTEDGQGIFSAADVRTYSIEDIVAEHGTRVPSTADAQWHFRVGVVLLTDADHPATTEQLDRLSEHAEWFSRREVDGRDGLYNYYEATGGRGSVTTGGLTELRRAVPVARGDLPPSFGVVPEPRLTLIDGRCLPLGAVSRP